MKKKMFVVTSVIVVFITSFAPLGAQSQHVVASVKDAQWGPAPPFIPAGAKLSVLSGDPTKPVPYAVRLMFPAHYTIAPHSHPTDENVVIVSGALTFGMGEKLVKSADNKTLRTGGFALMPAEMNHFAYTSGDGATIVLYGVGPVEFKYVNPADDPRNVKRAAR